MPFHAGILLFPKNTQLDLTGPFEVLRRIPGAEVHLVWKDTNPVASDSGLRILPTTTLDGCPPLDLVFVPGGIGQMAVIEDTALLDFVAHQGERARWVTSVCTGAFVLGAAGLLDGYKATTHWAYHELLSLVGAIPTRDRVVVDRNRITGGGVTAGIDFALRVAAEVAGQSAAAKIALDIEYDPNPHFRGGHPDVADPALVARTRAELADVFAARRAGIERARTKRTHVRTVSSG